VHLGECCIGSCSGRFLLSLLRFLRITEFGVYQGAFAMCGVFDWKCSKISMLDAEAVSRVYIVGSDWLEYCFADKDFVTGREF
jgi:hypothetical protein